MTMLRKAELKAGQRMKEMGPSAPEPEIPYRGTFPSQDMERERGPGAFDTLTGNGQSHT